MKAFHKNEIWDIMSKHIIKYLITYKWVYKIKRKSDKNIDYYEIRLVAIGFFQKYG